MPKGLSPKKKKWIIIGTLIGVLVVAAVVTTVVLLERHHKKSSHNVVPVPPGGHKYKCNYDAGTNSHVCIVDDADGTCSTNDCCKFDCDGSKCVASCSGTYSTLSACHGACNEGKTKYYACPNCDATDDPSDSPSPVACKDICNPSVNRIVLFNKGVVVFGSVGDDFANHFSLVPKVDSGYAPSAFGIVNTSTTGATVYEFPWNVQKTFLQDPVTVANLEVKTLGLTGTLTDLQMGFKGNATSLTNAVSGGANAVLVEEDKKWAMPTVSAMTATSTSFMHPTRDLSFFVNESKLFQGSSSGDSIAVSLVPSVWCAAQVDDTSILFMAEPGSNKVHMVTIDSKTAKFGAVQNSPFVGTSVHPAVPAGSTNFGKAMAISLDGTRLWIGSDQNINEFVLIDGTEDPVDFKWSAIKQAPVGSVTSIGASHNGVLMAYTLEGKQQIHCNLEHSIAFSVAGQVGFAGLGGTGVFQVTEKEYLIVSTATKQLIYGAVVVFRGPS